MITAGQIVLVSWRDGQTTSSAKPRPAVVVEDSDLFDPLYPNLLLVPLSNDRGLAIADLSITIAPSAENGAKKDWYALAHHVTATPKQRVTPTGSRITPEQLQQIRRLIGVTIGIG